MIKPKLALIPAAQGSKLYSVLPSNGVGDFDFTRGSAATRVNKDGLIETVGSGVSRLNYPLIDGVVSGCPSHILEPTRSNKVTYSESFDNAYWTKTQSTIYENSIISPDGSINADKLQTNTSSAEHSVLSGNTSIVNGTTYTVSLFAKAAEKTFLFIGWNSAGFGSPATSFFDLTTGEYKAGTGQTITVTKFPNGWYKFSTTRTASATASSNTGIRIGLCDSLLTSTTIGQNTTDGIYIWGAQIEQGSYPTSYIPNYGTALGVTRSAETANGSGDASTFNDSEGVLMAEMSALTNTGETRVISISDGSTSNNVYVNINNVGSIGGQIVSGGVPQCNFSSVIVSPNISQLNFNKIAITYKVNDFQLWINGIKVAYDNSGITFTDGVLNRLNFDFGNGLYDVYGNVKQLQYFDSALNGSDLETLTSWQSFTDMANGQLYTIE